MATYSILMLSLFCSNCCMYKVTGGVIKSSITSIGTRLVVQSLSDHNGKSCNQACKEIGSTCNFSKINMIPQSEMKNKILEMLPNKKYYLTESTLVKDQYKNHNEAYDPALNVENGCTQGFEQIGYIKADPLCETTGTNMFARICQCGDHNVTNSKTSIGTWLIAQDFKTSEQKDCLKTCQESGMVCDFNNFGSIPLSEWKTLIPNILPREICHSYYEDSPSVLVNNFYKNYNDPMDPMFNKWNNCASGYLDIGGTNVPKCSGNGTSQYARICQCKKAMSNANCVPQGQLLSYSGLKRTTMSGKPCISFTGLDPYFMPTDYFCRNPTSKEYPYCYYEGIKWEYCFEQECPDVVLNGERCTTSLTCPKPSAVCTDFGNGRGSYCLDVCTSDGDCAGSTRCKNGKCRCNWWYDDYCTVDEDCCSGKCKESTKRCGIQNINSGCTIDSECSEFMSTDFGFAQDGECDASSGKCVKAN